MAMTAKAGREVGMVKPAIIREALDILCMPGEVYELRIPNTGQATVSGYFNDFDKMAGVAAQQSGKAPGIYLTLNPVNSGLLARQQQDPALRQEHHGRQRHHPAPMASHSLRRRAVSRHIFDRRRTRSGHHAGQGVQIVAFDLGLAGADHGRLRQRRSSSLSY
jgi:hypothetical protein